MPEAGPVATPIVGEAAQQFFHACPNNHGGSSLPNNVRIKVVLKDSSGQPAFTTKNMICIQFRGGPQAQGFTTGNGADSIIANSQWNQSPLCPNVRCLEADANPAGGVAYITFAGGNPLSPGTELRDPCRKWGHYDSSIPVYVNGVEIQGRLDEQSANGTYVLRIKNVDHSGGLTAIMNQGEAVTAADFNAVYNGQGIHNAVSFWRDFNWDLTVGIVDLNMVMAHLNHDCDTPNNDAGDALRRADSDPRRPTRPGASRPRYRIDADPGSHSPTW